MGKFIELSGKKIKNWKVIKRVFLKKGRTHWLCLCKCGKESIIYASHLLNGRSTKCKICHNKQAVKKRPIKHGNCILKNSKEYRIWTVMKTRCLNKKHSQFKHYGGRGIIICDNWKNSFITFFKDMGKCPKGMSIDRIDVNGNYCKENCKWSTMKEQCQNKRNNIKYEYNSYTNTLPEWSRIMNIPQTTLRRYIKNNSWDSACEKFMN